MDGLTAKVFRTYNASITLQAQLKELTSGTSLPDVNLHFHTLSEGLASITVFVWCALRCRGGEHSCQDLVLQQGQQGRGHPVQPSEGPTQDLREVHAEPADQGPSAGPWMSDWRCSFGVLRLTRCPFHLLQIDAKKEQLSAAKRELKSAKADAKVRKDEKSKK